MDLETIMLGDISWTEKVNNHIVSMGSWLVLIKEGSKGNRALSITNQGAESDNKPASLTGNNMISLMCGI